MSKLTKVTLHGILGETLKNKEWKLAINSVGEAMRAIEMNSKHLLYKTLLELDKQGLKYRVIINGSDFLCEETPTIEKPETIFNSQLCAVHQNLKTIDIVPIIEGAGDNAFGALTAILGVILIIIGIILLPAGIGSVLIVAGIGLLAAGVTSLLSRPPKFEDFREIDGLTGRTSYLFNGPQNVTREGGPVPVGYGRLLVGSQVIGASYVVKNIDAGTIDTAAGDAGSVDTEFSAPTDSQLTGDGGSVTTNNFHRNNDFIFDLSIRELVFARFWLNPGIEVNGVNISYQWSVIKLDDLGDNTGIFLQNASKDLYHTNNSVQGIINIFNNAFLSVACVTAGESDGLFAGGNFILTIKDSAGVDIQTIKSLIYFNDTGTIPRHPTNNQRFIQPVEPRGPDNTIGTVWCMYVYRHGDVYGVGDNVEHEDILTNNNKVLIGGEFTSVVQTDLDGTTSTATRQGIARLGVDSDASKTFRTIDTTFNTNPQVEKTGGTAVVYAICVDEATGLIYIGGDFNKVGGVDRVGIARLNNNGSHDTSFPNLNLKYNNDSSDATVFSIAIHKSNIDGTYLSKVVIGGNFTSVHSVSAGMNVQKNRIARFNSAGQIDDNSIFNVSILGGIYNNNPHLRAVAIEQASNKIVIGGNFGSISKADGTDVRLSSAIARINSDGTHDIEFWEHLPRFRRSSNSPYLPTTAGLNGTVHNIRIQESDGDIYVGGIWGYDFPYYSLNPLQLIGVPERLLRLNGSPFYR